MKIALKVRIIASVLVQAFAVEQIAYAAPLAGREMAAAVRTSVPSLRIDLPQHFAKISDRSEDGQKTFVLIEDPHTNTSGQRNIAAVLPQIMKTAGVSTILVEGGVGDVSLQASGLKLREAKRDVEKIAEFHLRRGEMSGAEYANFISENPFTLWGVEEAELYEQSVQEYGCVAKNREESLQSLGSIEATVRAIKMRVYPPSLQEFDASCRAYVDGRLPITDYFQLLIKEADHQKISRGRLNDLALIREMERSIDFSKAEIEQRRLANASHEKENSMVQPAKAARETEEARVATDWLEGALEGKKDFQELKKYVAYRRAFESIDLEALLSEANSVERKIYQAMTRTQAEKELHALAENVRLARGLVELSLTPGEFEDYLKYENAGNVAFWTGTLNARLAEARADHERWLFLDEKLESSLRAAERFYELAEERDRTFVRNALSHMAQDGERHAVLVAGGFHMPNLKKLLAEKNISFVVVTPRVTHETNKKRYEEQLLGTAVSSETKAVRHLAVRPFKTTAQFEALAKEIPIAVVSKPQTAQNSVVQRFVKIVDSVRQSLDMRPLQSAGIVVLSTLLLTVVVACGGQGSSPQGIPLPTPIPVWSIERTIGSTTYKAEEWDGSAKFVGEKEGSRYESVVYTPKWPEKFTMQLYFQNFLRATYGHGTQALEYLEQADKSVGRLQKIKGVLEPDTIDHTRINSTIMSFYWAKSYAYDALPDFFHVENSGLVRRFAELSSNTIHLNGSVAHVMVAYSGHGWTNWYLIDGKDTLLSLYAFGTGEEHSAGKNRTEYVNELGKMKQEAELLRDEVQGLQREQVEQVITTIQNEIDEHSGARLAKPSTTIQQRLVEKIQSVRAILDAQPVRSIGLALVSAAMLMICVACGGGGATMTQPVKILFSIEKLINGVYYGVWKTDEPVIGTSERDQSGSQTKKTSYNRENLRVLVYADNGSPAVFTVETDGSGYLNGLEQMLHRIKILQRVTPLPTEAVEELREAHSTLVVRQFDNFQSLPKNFSYEEGFSSPGGTIILQITRSADTLTGRGSAIGFTYFNGGNAYTDFTLMLLPERDAILSRDKSNSTNYTHYTAGDDREKYSEFLKVVRDELEGELKHLIIIGNQGEDYQELQKILVTVQRELDQHTSGARLAVEEKNERRDAITAETTATAAAAIDATTIAQVARHKTGVFAMAKDAAIGIFTIRKSAAGEITVAPVSGGEAILTIAAEQKRKPSNIPTESANGVAQRVAELNAAHHAAERSITPTGIKEPVVIDVSLGILKDIQDRDALRSHARILVSMISRTHRTLVSRGEKASFRLIGQDQLTADQAGIVIEEMEALIPGRPYLSIGDGSVVEGIRVRVADADEPLTQDGRTMFISVDGLAEDTLPNLSLPLLLAHQAGAAYSGLFQAETKRIDFVSENAVKAARGLLEAYNTGVRDTEARVDSAFALLRILNGDADRQERKKHSLWLPLPERIAFQQLFAVAKNALRTLGSAA